MFNNETNTDTVNKDYHSESKIKNDKEASKNFKKGIRGIKRHCKKFKKEFIILLILGFISAIANGLVPFVTGKFFDSLINLSNNEVFGGLPLWTIYLIIWTIIQLIANNVDWIIQRINRFTDINIHFNIQSTGYSHFLRLPISFHKNEHIQGLVDKINVAGWRVSGILRDVVEIIPQILSVILGLTLVTLINDRLAIILVSGVIIYSLLLFRILKRAAGVDHDAQELWSQSYDHASSVINQIESVKQAASEKYEEERIRINFTEKTFKPWKKLQIIWSNVEFYQKIVVFITQLGVFIFSINLIQAGSISVGDLIAVNGYSMMFFGPFVQLGYSWQNFQNGLTAAAQAEDIFEQKTEIYKPNNFVKKEIVGEIEFKNVTFKYEEGDDVLKNINCKINKGESIALVGRSGSGKSTFASLISAYFFSQNGSVLIDNTPTNEFDLLNLRKQIAIVPQEIALFNDTIENNIKYGNFDATFEDVKKVARESDLEDFIKSQKDGYQTLVGERGVKLSVGQKQRLAIARAMLRDPKILILDEPTSALDSVTEKVVTDSLVSLMKNRTTIIIAHRLSTVKNSDNIFVFEKGRMVESGNHAELLKKEDGHYKKLHDYQIGIY